MRGRRARFNVTACSCDSPCKLLNRKMQWRLAQWCLRPRHVLGPFFKGENPNAQKSIFDENFSDGSKTAFLWVPKVRNLLPRCVGVVPCMSDSKNSNSIFICSSCERAFFVVLCAQQLDESCRNGNLPRCQSIQLGAFLLQQHGEKEHYVRKK
jgi:hypothetical protein